MLLIIQDYENQLSMLIKVENKNEISLEFDLCFVGVVNETNPEMTRRKTILLEQMSSEVVRTDSNLPLVEEDEVRLSSRQFLYINFLFLRLKNQLKVLSQKKN